MFSRFLQATRGEKEIIFASEDQTVRRGKFLNRVADFASSVQKGTFRKQLGQKFKKIAKGPNLKMPTFSAEKEAEAPDAHWWSGGTKAFVPTDQYAASDSDEDFAMDGEGKPEQPGELVGDGDTTESTALRDGAASSRESAADSEDRMAAAPTQPSKPAASLEPLGAQGAENSTPPPKGAGNTDPWADSDGEDGGKSLALPVAAAAARSGPARRAGELQAGAGVGPHDATIAGEAAPTQGEGPSKPLPFKGSAAVPGANTTASSARAVASGAAVGAASPTTASSLDPWADDDDEDSPPARSAVPQPRAQVPARKNPWDDSDSDSIPAGGAKATLPSAPGAAPSQPLRPSKLAGPAPTEPVRALQPAVSEAPPSASPGKKTRKVKKTATPQDGEPAPAERANRRLAKGEGSQPPSRRAAGLEGAPTPAKAVRRAPKAARAAAAPVASGLVADSDDDVKF